MNLHTEKARRVLAVLCGCLWLVAAIGTHIPAWGVPQTGCSDKTLHAAGYAVLAGSFLLALWSRGIRRKKRFLLAILVLLVYAAVDEITQPLVGRYASVLDWVADAVGVGIAVLIDIIIGGTIFIIGRLRTDKV